MAGHAVVAQQLGACRRLACCLPADLRTLFAAAPVLHRAVVGLQAREIHARQAMRLPRQGQHGLGTCDAAAALAHIHLHQHVDLHARLRHGLGQLHQVGRVVHAHGHARRARQPGQQRVLGGAHHLIADQDVAHAGRHEGHGLAHLLAADAARAQRQLAQRDLRALVRLGMRAQRHAMAVGPVLHGAQVGVEDGQVQRQAGCIDPVERIAGPCGRLHCQAAGVIVQGHGAVPHSCGGAYWAMTSASVMVGVWLAKS